MEKVDFVRFFAHADKANRDARNLFNRKRRAATGIAIHLRKTDARKVQPVEKSFRDIDRFLANHRIRDKEDFLGLHRIASLFEFLHQLFVYLQATRGIVDDDIETVLFRVFASVLDDFDRISFSLVIHRNPDGFSEDLQLFDGRRAIDVRRDEKRFLLALAPQIERNLCSKSRLAGSLETDHHDADRRLSRKDKFLRFAAHHLDQFIVDDLDNLLPGRHRRENLLSHRLFLHRLHKIARNVKAHVRFEKGPANLAERIRYVFLGQGSLSTQIFQRRFQRFSQLRKHHNAKI